ncbi:MAG TPA: hypothetical protein VM406_05650, partial [Noviherbaspirillum sp.]|nr:hypothetical protein [Noviherbaspirillum sp.]
FGISDIFIAAAVFGILGPIFFAIDNRHTAWLERQARAEPAVLEACAEIAAAARSPYAGAVKEQCLIKFDRSHARSGAASS